MAARINLKHDEATRLKIKTSQLVNRLNQIAMGEIEVDAIQLKAIEIALRKTLPDLASVAITGPDGGPVKHSFVIEAPAVAPTVEDWQKQHGPTRLLQ